ncbi:MAG TPA: hypothetical protein PKD55_14015 [Bellilinea sp.]|nr:hypothetical protein [Bellilinea sp.]
MPRYIFSNGKITVEEGVYTPFKKVDKQQRSRGVLLIAEAIRKPIEQSESKDKEHPDGKE